MAAIKLRKQSKPILKMRLKPDQGLVLNGRKSEQGKQGMNLAFALTNSIIWVLNLESWFMKW